jgi:hypothetical protein
MIIYKLPWTVLPNTVLKAMLDIKLSIPKLFGKAHGLVRILED